MIIPIPFFPEHPDSPTPAMVYLSYLAYKRPGDRKRFVHSVSKCMVQAGAHRPHGINYIETRRAEAKMKKGLRHILKLCRTVWLARERIGAGGDGTRGQAQRAYDKLLKLRPYGFTYETPGSIERSKRPKCARGAAKNEGVTNTETIKKVCWERPRPLLAMAYPVVWLQSEEKLTFTDLLTNSDLVDLVMSRANELAPELERLLKLKPGSLFRPRYVVVSRPTLAPVD
jgi:hypothetical protein